MLHYDKIGLSEGIDLTKSNRSKECMICHNLSLIIDSNFEIPYAMVVMVCQC